MVSSALDKNSASLKFTNADVSTAHHLAVYQTKVTIQSTKKPLNPQNLQRPYLSAIESSPPPSPPPPPAMPFTNWGPSPSPSPSLSPALSPSPTSSEISNSAWPPPPPPPPSRLPVDFSPPLIAMVVVVAAAFLVVTYSRLISRRLIPPLRRLHQFMRRRRRRRFLPSTTSDLDSLPPDSDLFDRPFSPYGLDDSAIKSIPLSLYSSKPKTNSPRDCAVCLLEFDEDQYVRTLPICSHAFHVDCIDVWLKSHANCPLCRAGVITTDSPLTPLMAARIRPSFDEPILLNMNLEPFEILQPRVINITEIIEEPSPRVGNATACPNCEENRFNFVLKRSYSFGFERNLASDRMLMTEPNTASPWRYRRGGTSGFWSKRPSPFGSLMAKPRVFSFRYYRGMKASPFFRRRGFFPLSERFSGGGSSRRSKSMTSPMFPRSAASGVAVFSSSRLRCGDPEALLSPERFNRR